MNEKITALSVYLASLKPLIDGSLCIDRDRLAADLGLRPSQMVRMLAKAESKLGISINGNQVNYLTDAEIFKCAPKVSIAEMTAAVAEIMRGYATQTSQSA